MPFAAGRNLGTARVSIQADHFVIKKAMSDLMRFQSANSPTEPVERRLRGVLPVSAEQLVDRRTIRATVFAVVPEFKQVRLQSSDGHHYAITAKTPGIDWKSLREGQCVECIVTTTLLPRVLEAHALG
jgi:hypothetical protein